MQWRQVGNPSTYISMIQRRSLFVRALTQYALNYENRAKYWQVKTYQSSYLNRFNQLSQDIIDIKNKT